MNNIEFRLDQITARLWNLPADVEHHTTTNGVSAPIYHAHMCNRDDKPYDIISVSEEFFESPQQNVARYMNYTTANFFANAPQDMAFLITLVKEAQRKIKYLEGELKKCQK